MIGYILVCLEKICVKLQLGHCCCRFFIIGHWSTVLIVWILQVCCNCFFQSVICVIVRFTGSGICLVIQIIREDGHPRHIDWYYHILHGFLLVLWDCYCSYWRTKLCCHQWRRCSLSLWGLLHNFFKHCCFFGGWLLFVFVDISYESSSSINNYQYSNCNAMYSFRDRPTYSFWVSDSVLLLKLRSPTL